MASPTPVLPEVGSTIVPPGFSRPWRSASSIMAMAGRSLTLPPGLNSSTLAMRSQVSSAPARRRRTIGVWPTRSRSESATCIPEVGILPGCASAMTQTLLRAYAARMQVHEFSVDLNAPVAEVWDMFWYRGPDRPQAKIGSIEILHPGNEVGEGLVRHCTFPV